MKKKIPFEGLYCDTRMGGFPKYYLGFKPANADMRIPEVMVVEHAERFGLSQLHQLRGHVGRGAEQRYGVLLASNKQTDVAREGLGIMERTNDGFKLAAKDLEIRSLGEIMGTCQAGLPEFRVANLVVASMCCKLRAKKPTSISTKRTNLPKPQE